MTDPEPAKHSTSRSVTIDMPSAGEGTLVEVQALGVFENGTTTEVTDEQVQTFEALGNTWPEGEDELVLNEDRPEEEGLSVTVQSEELAPEELPAEEPSQEEPVDAP